MAVETADQVIKNPEAKDTEAIKGGGKRDTEQQKAAVECASSSTSLPDADTASPQSPRKELSINISEISEEHVPGSSKKRSKRTSRSKVHGKHRTLERKSGGSSARRRHKRDEKDASDKKKHKKRRHRKESKEETKVGAGDQDTSNVSLTASLATHLQQRKTKAIDWDAWMADFADEDTYSSDESD